MHIKNNINYAILFNGILKSLIYPLFLILFLRVADHWEFEIISSGWKFFAILLFALFVNIIFRKKNDEYDIARNKFKILFFHLFIFYYMTFFSTMSFMLPPATYQEICYSVIFATLYSYFDGNVTIFGFFRGLIYPVLVIISMKIATSVKIQVSLLDFIYALAGIFLLLLILEFRKQKNNSKFGISIFSISFFCAYITQIILKLSDLLLPISIIEILSYVVFTTIYSILYYKILSNFEEDDQFYPSKWTMIVLAILMIFISIKVLHRIQKIQKNVFIQELQNKIQECKREATKRSEDPNKIDEKFLLDCINKIK